ncbi:class I SAM-dependent methyltransferase [Dactylosporangium darangshiense]|uniref:Methyltransferase type 11 domain-containing protein n=1 Tax=Dactylosporangium darangshiense TaxID=579108 RepID=A0ABP8DFW3_9ACTN
MALIAYNGTDAAAFAANRHLSDDALSGWRSAIIRYVDPHPGHLLDLGCGTGTWSRAFAAWWPEAEIVAVEPSAAMRDRAVFSPILPGDAANVPAADATFDAAWLSTVIHHVPDLPAAARELRRVLRPGAPVLIRSAFSGRHEGIALFRYFPEAIEVLDQRFPTVAAVESAFAEAGFTTEALEPVPQPTAPSLADFASTLRREAHTPLQLITDEAYAAGLARLHAAAELSPDPVVDALDLLVLR